MLTFTSGLSLQPPRRHLSPFTVYSPAMPRSRNFDQLHCKKRLATFPSPAGMSFTKLSLGGKNGDGNVANLFLRCIFSLFAWSLRSLSAIAESEIRLRWVLTEVYILSVKTHLILFLYFPEGDLVLHIFYSHNDKFVTTPLFRLISKQNGAQFPLGKIWFMFKGNPLTIPINFRTCIAALVKDRVN